MTSREEADILQGTLYRTGRRYPDDELEQWRRMSHAINLVLTATLD
jgi:hypothetical protein